MPRDARDGGDEQAGKVHTEQRAAARRPTLNVALLRSILALVSLLTLAARSECEQSGGGAHPSSRVTLRVPAAAEGCTGAARVRCVPAHHRGGTPGDSEGLLSGAAGASGERGGAVLREGALRLRGGGEGEQVEENAFWDPMGIGS